ncbi:Transposase, Mutator family [Citreimonas salinaria]|uniref:Transposase, Mutator family n=1 Tax=Citreimonas salinaria TaxID=321339 RepID=A0A1H3M0W6_9RHOB|nr:Transposase, Mutator family [Citreimonas salinaria]
MLAVAEMYVKGVSTRDAEAVMREFGIESLSYSQVSRAAKLLDEELEAWRNRPLGQVIYRIFDARYEKMRHGGVEIDDVEGLKKAQNLVRRQVPFRQRCCLIQDVDLALDERQVRPRPAPLKALCSDTAL